MCAANATNYDSCVSCGTMTPYSDDCINCALLPTSLQQASCYNCRERAKTAAYGCADCISYTQIIPTFDSRACVSCFTSTRVEAASAKQYCMACQNTFHTQRTRSKCIQCLGEDSTTDYWGQCLQLQPAPVPDSAVTLFSVAVEPGVHLEAAPAPVGN